MDIHEFLRNLPGPNRFLVIMSFLLVILYFTYRNMIEREKGQEELKQKVDELSDTIEQKNTRIEELHHRIKNNLQILSCMLEEEANEFDNVSWKKKLKKCKARVKSIAMIHDVLDESADQEFIELKPYLERVVHKSSQFLNVLASGVDINTDIDPMTIDRQMATTCGLLVNELMTNCYQHAFENSDDAQIEVTLHRVNGHVNFCVTDNGSGNSDAMFEEASDSLGSDVVSSLVEYQLQGEIELDRSKNGTNVQITFPAVYGSTEN